jgi:hypothetical protein
MSKMHANVISKAVIGFVFGVAVAPAGAAPGLNPPSSIKTYDSVVSAGGQPVPEVNNLGPKFQPSSIGQTVLVPLWTSPVPSGDPVAARNCRAIKQSADMTRPASSAVFPVRFNQTIQYPAQMPINGMASTSTGKVVVQYAEQVNLTKSPQLYFAFEGCLVNFGAGDVACNPATSNGPKMLNNETIQVSGSNVTYQTQILTDANEQFTLKTGVGWYSQGAPQAVDKVLIETCYPEMTVFGEYMVDGVQPPT